MAEELTFSRDFEPAYGRAVPVAPGVRRLTAPNGGPFTFRGTNSYLIGEGAVAILDPGPDDEAHIAALADAASDGVSHILVSHSHADHSAGARRLQHLTGAPILAEGPHRPARLPLAGEDDRLDAGGDLDFVPDRTVSDGETIEGVGWSLTAIATPGHAANHMAFALDGTPILFSGDHVMGWSTTVVAPPGGSMADYMASLDRLAARPETLYLPGHGGAIDNAPAYVRALRAHRRLREASIVERIERGDRTIPAIVAAIYRTTPPALHGAAALSVLAHVEDLTTRGRLRLTAGSGLSGIYEPVTAA